MRENSLLRKFNTNKSVVIIHLTFDLEHVLSLKNEPSLNVIMTPETFAA